MLPNVTVTAAARKFMNRIVRFGGQGDEAGFRLTVTAGGCSGYNSEFTVAPNPLPGDATLEFDGLKVFLPAESRLLLEGVIIDFADTPTTTGLTFVNPGAGPCGCSTSAPGPAAMPGVTKIEIGAIRRN
jgi:iron-sulfur cluster assembly accessory protein